MKRALKDRLLMVITCVILVLSAALTGMIIERFVALPNILLVFLPVILFAAVRYGFWAASATSVLSILATSFLLAEPIYSFAVSDPANIWALTIFLAVSAFTSSLAAQLRERAAAASRHSRVTEELFAFSSMLASISEIKDLLIAAAEKISSMLGVRVMVLVPENGSVRVLASAPKGDALSFRERLAAIWCWEHSQPAGRGSGSFHGLEQLYLPLTTDRGIVGVIGIGRDASGPLLTEDESRLLDALSNQVAVSLERAQLAEEMHAARVLAEADKLRTALLTSISHDLRTPLASILGNVSSLRQYGQLYDEATRGEMLALAESETLRLNRFVDNLLHMTRIDAGALRPRLEMVDLADLIGSALKRADGQLQQHRVMTDLPPDQPMILLDFVLAEQVLVNLLENAAKYSPPGSVITVSASSSGDHWIVSVADEGPGIPPQDLERIFERFFRAEATDHRPAGVGLGLGICKGFVEAMGGRIKARNRKDRSGAVFEVFLPQKGEEKVS